MRSLIFFLLLFIVINSSAQSGSIDSFRIHNDIKVTVDRPVIHKGWKTIVCFFALPNGNSTEQTMGKKMQAGDDWHYDIQHIRAQTAFIRQRMEKKNFVVIYLENTYKSWPSWKGKHADFPSLIPHLVDSLTKSIALKNTEIYLNGHSGGGSFIFGYLFGVVSIPKQVKRISFIDSDYGYDSSYYFKVKQWLTNVKGSTLTVFAYNDSIALYNGKPFVSATGGTWYRSWLWLHMLEEDYNFTQRSTDSLELFSTYDKKILFCLKPNYDRGIYHTQQVEFNGFIHSVLFGTKHESDGYAYYGKRAYGDLIR